VRVLHLTPELPYSPGGSGGSTRQFHLLRRLVELGHEVTVVAPATPMQQSRVGLLESAGIAAALYRRPNSRIRETAHALVGEPSLTAVAAWRPVLAWQVSVFWHYLKPIAARVARAWGPDVVGVEHDHAARWAGDLDPALPSVLVFENLGWAYYDSRARARSGAARAALRLEARRFRRFDARHVRDYQRLVTVSSTDADGLTWTGLPRDVVSNGVATDEIIAQPDPTGPPTVLFSGTMAYPPNAEGIIWFVREAWLRLREAVPDVRLLVVGRDPPAAVRQLARDPAIEVTGSVEDVRPYFARATAVIVPLLSGGGTRLKLLEALSAGRPVVSTSIGAEGIDLRRGEEAAIEDAPLRFADAVARLLQNRELRERMGTAGRDLVERRYDWRILGEAFADTLAHAAESGTAES
jgi:glycosyltransferase involved in cell wall biosynthesis